MEQSSKNKQPYLPGMHPVVNITKSELIHQSRQEQFTPFYETLQKVKRIVDNRFADTGESVEQIRGLLRQLPTLQ